jgi:mannose-6-phosphate isomerase-like protein (cupin superfamily)
MRVVSQQDITTPIQNPKGELIYEMFGRRSELGGTSRHSFVYVIIPPGKSTSSHFHKVSEETYYILKGTATVIIEDSVHTLSPGQACLIMPMERHKVSCAGNEDLEFLAVSAPAWIPDDSFFLE